MINGLDLFSGTGGLSIALRDWVKPVAFCERDRYCQAVLLSRMATGEMHRAPIWDDITSLGASMLPSGIEIIFGGFPCQNISIVGDGTGLEGEQSKLYFEFRRLVCEIRPTFVFMENVPAITLRGLERIALDLTSLGYDSRWTIVSAGELGAPHLRERWWLLAHANGARLQESGRESKPESECGREARRTPLRLVQNNLWPEPPSDVCRMDDGLPFKTHRLRALGNSVVPAVAKEAFMRLMGISA